MIWSQAPNAWHDGPFLGNGMLAAAGFEVSAVRKDGITQLVTVERRAGSPCLLQTDILNSKITINGKKAAQNQFGLNK